MALLLLGCGLAQGANVSEFDLLTGRFDPARVPEIFVRVPSSDGRAHWLRKEAAASLRELKAEAAKAGFLLPLVSTFRSFEDQKRIWETKFRVTYLKAHPDPADRVKAILRYSSVPGSSRHHWGTDVDLVSVDPAWWKGAEGRRLHAWLSIHGPAKGWIQAYSEGRTGGYSEERWHWSYAPLSRPLLASWLNRVGPSGLRGFEGERWVPARFIEEYVEGIHPKLREKGP